MSFRTALNYLQFSAFLAFLVPKQAFIFAVEFEIVLAAAATIDVFVTVLVGRHNENVFEFLQLFHEQKHRMVTVANVRIMTILAMCCWCH